MATEVGLPLVPPASIAVPASWGQVWQWLMVGIYIPRAVLLGRVPWVVKSKWL